MDTKKGTPVATVKFWTDDLKIVITAALGQGDSEVLAITTTKDLSSPTGTFTINLVPKITADGKTWFDRLDAFDFVEISFKGIDDDFSHVVMRGLIDKVSKNESWEGGVPARTISVTGRDLASMFTDHGIYFMPELGGKFAKEAVGGVIVWGGIKNYQEVSNISNAFQIMLKKFEAGLNLTFGYGQINLLEILQCQVASTFPDEITTYGNLKVYQGDWWNAMAWYADKPFHELFLYDDDLHSNLILRPARLKDARGNYHKSVNNLLSSDIIESGIMYPSDFKFSDLDMVSSNLEKNHQEVYNYYLTFPSMMVITKMDLRGQYLDEAGGDPTKVTNPFFQLDKTLPAYIGKYGFRKYEGGTVFVGSKATEPIDPGQTGTNSTRGKKYESVVADVSTKKKIRERNEMVVAWFLHNEHLLSGEIQIAGTNKAIIGTYATNMNDNMEYYVEGVTHQFVQFQSFRTSLRVTRGQFDKEHGGLVGLGDWAELRYSTMNRFYFDATGVVNNNPPISGTDPTWLEVSYEAPPASLLATIPAAKKAKKKSSPTGLKIKNLDPNIPM